MQGERRFYGYVHGNNHRLTGLNVPAGQWLEEFGSMLEVAVERARQEQIFLAAATENRSPSHNLSQDCEGI